MEKCFFCYEEDRPTKSVIVTGVVSPPVGNLSLLAKLDAKNEGKRTRKRDRRWVCTDCQNQFSENIEASKKGR